MESQIRPAGPADVAAVAAIYDHEAVHGHATFDTAPQGSAPWEQRLASADPLLVAVDGAAVLGFAYAAPYRARPAYRQTRETSVYLRHDARGRGVGRALYATLLPLLEASDVHRVIAAIALPNQASEALHRSAGFVAVGTFTEVGRKFDRWIDVRFYERGGATPTSGG